MNLKAKKIIARELLIMLSILTICLIIFGVIYSSNSFKKYKIENLSKEITNNNIKSESLRSQFENKKENQLLFHEDFHAFIYYLKHPRKILKEGESLFTAEAIKPSEALIYAESISPVYKNDQNLLEFDTSLNYYINNDNLDFNLIKNFKKFKEEFDFTSPEQFKKHLITYLINPTDVSNYNEALKTDGSTSQLLRKQNDLEISVLSTYEQYQIIVKVFLVLLFLLFLIRYIYYTIKWSLSILNKK